MSSYLHDVCTAAYPVFMQKTILFILTGIAHIRDHIFRNVIVRRDKEF